MALYEAKIGVSVEFWFCSYVWQLWVLGLFYFNGVRYTIAFYCIGYCRLDTERDRLGVGVSVCVLRYGIVKRVYNLEPS
jgi:hypothetical protein